MIVKSSVILELPETLEKGIAQKVCEKPYHTQRVEDLGESRITWYGYNTNWIRDLNSDQWYWLRGGEFVPCDIPEYEILYLRLKQDKK